MDLILSRLTNPAIILWLVEALLGLAVSIGTVLIMRYEIALHPAVLRSPSVAAMKRHDVAAEAVRGLAQLIALAIGVAYVLNLVPGAAIVWGLALMNLALVSNSANELLLTLRLLGRIKPISMRPVRRVRSKKVALPGAGARVAPKPGSKEKSV